MSGTDRAAADGPLVWQWWAEHLVTGADGDTLGRSGFASQVAALLNEHVAGTSESAVLGLVGPWGSGKSSTIELITAELTDTWHAAMIDPWAVSDPDAVIAEVLGAIASGLDQHAGARATLGKLSAAARRAAPFIKAMGALGGLAGAALEAATASDSGPTVAELLKKMREEMDDERSGSVLVVIDDVDRLQPDELLALFKAVRVLGRLPRVHYLLAYDEQTLLDVLMTTAVAKTEDRALAFLEKVVTVRLDQPPASTLALRGQFDSELPDILAEAGRTLPGQARDRLAIELPYLFRAALTQPRVVRRYLGQVRLYLPLLGADIDTIDFLVLTWLRITHPSTYQALSRDRDWLTGAEGSEDIGRRWADTLQEMGPDRADMLGRLFPRLRNVQLLGASNADDDRDAQWDHLTGQRAASPAYIDTYFALGANGDELDDSVIAEAFTYWIRGGSVDNTGASAFTDVVTAGGRAHDPEARLAIAALARAQRQASALPGPDATAALEPVSHLCASVLAHPDPVQEEAIRLLSLLMCTCDVTAIVNEAPDVNVDDGEYARLIVWCRAAASALNTGPPRTALVANTAERRQQLTDVVAKLAYRCLEALLAHARAGDDAPDTPVADLFDFAYGYGDKAAATTALRDAVGREDVGIYDLAARLMRPRAGGGVYLDAALFAMLTDAANQPGGELAASSEPQVGPWGARRAQAARELREYLRTQRHDTLPDIAAIPETAPRSRIDFRPSLDIPTSSELSVSVFLMPWIEDAAMSSEPIDRDLLDEATLAVFEQAPLYKELSRQLQAWEVTGSRGIYTAVAAKAKREHANPAWVQSLTAQLTLPQTMARPDVLALAMGLSLERARMTPELAVGIDPEGETPRPPKPWTLEHLHRIIERLIATIDLLPDALAALPVTRTNAASAACFVVIRTSISIPDLLELGPNTRLVAPTAMAEHTWSGLLTIDSALRDVTGATTSAAAAHVLYDWLTESGYRDLEELTALAKSR